jgi:hypothetical protein
MDWIDLAQGRDHWSALVNTVMNFQVPIEYWVILLEWLRNWQLLKKALARRSLCVSFI